MTELALTLIDHRPMPLFGKARIRLRRENQMVRVVDAIVRNELRVNRRGGYAPIGAETAASDGIAAPTTRKARSDGKFVTSSKCFKFSN